MHRGRIPAKCPPLSAGIIMDFEDQALAQALKLPKGQEPLLVMPVGQRRQRLPTSPDREN